MTDITLEKRAAHVATLGEMFQQCANERRMIEADALAAAIAALRLSAGADGVGLIAAERQRQVSVEGWTTVHDDGHELGEMARAASCYAMPDGWRHQLVKLCWPWDATWWKPGDRIRELVKAGALVAAEIDRLQRAAAPRHEPGEG